MLKRALGIAFAFAAIGTALIVQAQETEPITQPTVDAAVATLLAQTQAAPAGLSATQTIQAALEAALTATAQASVAPAAQPAPTEAPTLDVSGLSVVSQTEIDLMAGPGGTAAYLAPDGVHFAHFDHRRICIYNGEQQERCVELGEDMPVIDSETIRWSPDSRYLALTEEFFRTFNEPDIWVIDTNDGSLRDLTDDGQGRVSISSDTWKNIDVFPQWLPDNRILFLRYNRLQGTIMPPMVYVVALDGSGLQKLGTLAAANPFAIYALDVQDNRLIYGYAASSETPDNGIWISDVDGGNARQIVHAEREHLPTYVDLSPDGRYILVGAPGTTFTNRPEDSLVYVVDVEAGQAMPIDPQRYVMSAGWSPTGSALIYAVFDPIQADLSGVYLSGTPGTGGRELLNGRYLGATSTLRQSFAWAANNVALLSRSPVRGIVLAQLGQ